MFVLFQNFDFKSIRVETPAVLVINGKKLDREQQVGANLQTFKQPD